MKFSPVFLLSGVSEKRPAVQAFEFYRRVHINNLNATLHCAEKSDHITILINLFVHVIPKRKRKHCTHITLSSAINLRQSSSGYLD